MRKTRLCQGEASQAGRAASATQALQSEERPPGSVSPELPVPLGLAFQGQSHCNCYATSNAGLDEVGYFLPV